MAAAVFMLLLIIVSYRDIKTGKIQDSLILLFLIPCVISVFSMPEIGMASRIAGVICGSLPLLIITLAVPGAFGGGDIKLMAVCGFFLGAGNIGLSLIIAVLLAGIFAVLLIVSGRKKRKDRFAFGPFLCTGMAAVFFAGEKIGKFFG